MAATAVMCDASKISVPRGIDEQIYRLYLENRDTAPTSKILKLQQARKDAADLILWKSANRFAYDAAWATIAAINVLANAISTATNPPPDADYIAHLTRYVAREIHTGCRARAIDAAGPISIFDATVMVSTAAAKLHIATADPILKRTNTEFITVVSIACSAITAKIDYLSDSTIAMRALIATLDLAYCMIDTVHDTFLIRDAIAAGARVAIAIANRTAARSTSQP